QDPEDDDGLEGGDTIARALLARGFVVMRWHAIHRDDPLFAVDGLMMEVPKPPQTVEQAELAMATFRAKKVVPDDHIFLLGHSLGAARAAMLVDKHKDCPGVVLLAGASLIPTKLDVVREIVAESNEDVDRKNPKPRAIQRHENAVQRLADKRDA
ncbi:MAG TPA: alpha/beta hydrolase, partial [Phycisphaerae bacterium]|nr:alpha/beta hydrolase [Phycisphaerae bacterium]